jgi:hypothetical protein
MMMNIMVMLFLSENFQEKNSFLIRGRRWQKSRLGGLPKKGHFSPKNIREDSCDRDFFKSNFGLKIEF